MERRVNRRKLEQVASLVDTAAARMVTLFLVSLSSRWQRVGSGWMAGNVRMAWDDIVTGNGKVAANDKVE
ncbi:hypothetical protein Pmani_007230 [Petrolisthes manimaculis]|uniref:Uncharacterized protein n=1 Tax=Petrolisthes manimaculis TaxID=1843537 RepID=A0AAE1UKY9_9EUCA|nr:hypothetical protein Pmani_007230 [Petrolisthes manimaculis]